MESAADYRIAELRIFLHNLSVLIMQKKILSSEMR